MEWSKEQQTAIQKAEDWLQSDQQVFRLFGYAGTGKTTLAKHLVEKVGGKVLFAAFTGKAAHVLASKGCAGASTIHQLIYNPKGSSKVKLKKLELDLLIAKQENDQQVVTKLNMEIKIEEDNAKRPSFCLNTDSIVKTAELLIIDECSMVDQQIGEDLLSFGTKILVLGDPAQLPPVKGTGFFTYKCEPDFLLSEIHRQAQDSPILKIATRVREQKQIALGKYGLSKIILVKEINKKEILECDQVIVGKNKTRFSYNKRIRELKGFVGNLPEIGDKLVCLKNNHELGLLNGAMFFVEETMVLQDQDKIKLVLRTEGSDAVLEVISHTHNFIGKELPFWQSDEAESFDFGYAITCHKAQGSQWDHVVLIDESFSFRKDRYKWLYTGVTRAAEKLTIIRV